MLVVNIQYYVHEIEGKMFRPLADIAKDVEGELWNSPLFSEASFYKITVENGAKHSVIEYRATLKKGEKDNV